MGLLIEGVWHDQWYDTDASDGRFVRSDSTFRNWVTPDGKPGPTGVGGFGAEGGRYHLYVSLACPWAHRALILRKLKGLDGTISLSIVHWLMLEEGWTFAEGPGVIPDPVNGANHLHEIYTKSSPTFSGRVTVPVLWDKDTGVIVSNESADIIRMLNSAFDGVVGSGPNFYPTELSADIDRINSRIYDTVNNGVYKAGFATAQTAYEEAVTPLFETLDWLEAHLSRTRYLVGNRLTEADIRLFTTLVRFDAVYVGHFKCNRRRIADYPALSGFVADIYNIAGVAETVNFDHIKRHYYESHRTINPSGVVPTGPELDQSPDNGRSRLGPPPLEYPTRKKESDQ